MNRNNRIPILKRSPRKWPGTRSVGIGQSGFAVVLLLLLALTLGCEGEEQKIERRSEQKPGATVDEITKTPNAYIGRKVTVSGEIKEVYGPNAFTIGNLQAPFGELLIVTVKDFPEIPDNARRAKVIEGDLVQITGEVQRYIPDDIQQQLDTDFDPEMTEYPVSHPVVFAESLRFTAEINKEAAEGMGAGKTPG